VSSSPSAFCQPALLLWWPFCCDVSPAFVPVRCSRGPNGLCGPAYGQGFVQFVQEAACFLGGLAPPLYPRTCHLKLMQSHHGGTCGLEIRCVPIVA
jgi:hypothetical protein